MRYSYPQNLILDIKTPQAAFSRNYWLGRYSKSFTTNLYISSTLGMTQASDKTDFSATLLGGKNTLSFNNTNIFKKTSKTNLSLTRLMKLKLNYLNNMENLSNGNLSSATKYTSKTKVNSSLKHLFDINYIKKERLYTKLKYSRSPAYDIVSGGAAAILSGFIGFLISEKFGIELVDSGDFYIVFMYAVFVSLSCRPLLRLLSQSDHVWGVLSVNHLLNYLTTIWHLFSEKVKSLLKYILSLRS